MKRFLIFFFVIWLLSGVALVLAGHGGLPNSGWTSGHVVQNIGDAATSIKLIAYNAYGDSYECLPQGLFVGESYNYLDLSDCVEDDGPLSPTQVYLPNGFNGSGAVYAGQPLAGVVNINNRGFGRAAGQYNATSTVDAATQISFPLVKYDHVGRTTTFFIQNASSASNTITTTFYMGNTPYTTTFVNVPSYARIIVQPGDVVTSASPTVGSLVVIGSQKIAGISLEHPTDEVTTNSLQASRAFVSDDHGDTIHCPMLRYEWGTKTTTSGLQVQNVGANTTTITVTYKIAAGNGVLTSTIHSRANVLPGESKNFLQSNHFYTNTLASAIITNSASEIVAVVNDRADGTNPKSYLSYACINSDQATTKISLPLVKEQFFGNTSGVQVQNTGDIAAHVELVYITHTNLTFTVTTTSPIPAGASKTFYNLTGGGTNGIAITSTSPIAAFVNTLNGVIVTSQSWNNNKVQPIVAIAIESSVNPFDPQDSKGYEGFNLEQ